MRRAVLLLLLLAGSALSQTLFDRADRIINSVAGQESIPNGNASVLAQDRAGFLWIGSEDGLVRYDGYDFRRFRLNDNHIRALQADDDGRLWVATQTGGVSLFDPSTESFKRIADVAAPRGNEARALALSSSTIWIGSIGGLAYANTNTLRVTQVIVPGGQPRNNIGSLLSDRRGDLWIGTSAGLLRRHSDGTFNDVAALDGKAIYRLFATSNGSIWASVFGGATFIVDPQTLAARPIDAQRAYAIAEARAGEVWIAPQGLGIEIRDASTGALRARLRHDVSIEETIDSDRVVSLLVDRGGLLWIGMEGAGLGSYNPSGDAFRILRHSAARNDGLSYGDIGALLESKDGTLWIGTRGNGVDVFRGDTREEVRPREGEDGQINALAEAKDGAIWMATRSELCRYDRASKALTRIPFSPFGATTGSIRSLFIGDDGIWVGTSAGLSRFDPATRQTMIAAFADGRPVTTSVSAIREDHRGVLWAATESGLVARLAGETTFRRFTHEPALDILEAHDGTLWLGTATDIKRLVMFDGRKARFEAIGSRIGREEKRTQTLLEDAQGQLWIEADERFDPKTFAHREFGKTEGAERTIWRGAALRTRDGNLLFGGPDGVLVVDPSHITTSSFQPPVVLTALRLNGALQPAGGLHEVTLRPGIRSIAFEFAALDFSAPGRNRYEYRLRGFDSRWTVADSLHRSATYTSLPPGSYVLELRGSNPSGVWGHVLSLPLTVLPAWYQTTAFRIFVVLLLIAATYPIYRVRLRAVEHRRRALEELVRARTAELSESEQRAREASHAKSVFLANMSHELRTPLNAVLGFAQILEHDPRLANDDAVRIIHRSGEHLLGLINDVLSLSKIEAGSLSLIDETFDLHDLLDAVHAIVASRAEQKDLDLTFDADASVPRYVQGDEGKLRQVLINLLGNAVKFTDRGLVSLRVRWSEGRAMFEITDTGRGIAEDEIDHLFQPFAQTETGRLSQEGTGLGLVISRRIVHLMGGEMRVTSAVAKGTTFAFDVLLPLASKAPPARMRSRVIGLADGERARRILVVDDALENRLLLSRLLAGAGFEVHEAANGADALEEWRRWQPELIFMDMRMPVMDGREATSRIREEEKERRTIIISLTASAFEHDREALMQSGSDAIMTKPFRIGALFELLAQQLGVRYRYEESETTIDVEAGVRRAGGNRELHRELLLRFAGELPQRLAELMSATAPNDLLHAIKGRAATLGLVRVAFVADSLERAALRGEKIDLRELREAFDEVRRRFPAESAAVSDAPIEAAEMEQVFTVLDLMAQHLAANDLAVTRDVDDLAALLAGRLAIEMDAIKTTVGDLDQTSGANAIAKMREALGARTSRPQSPGVPPAD